MVIIRIDGTTFKDYIVFNLALLQATASKPCEHEKEILRLIPSPTPPRQRLNQDSEGGREVREGGEGTEGSPVVSRSPVVSQTPRPHSA